MAHLHFRRTVYKSGGAHATQPGSMLPGSPCAPQQPTNCATSAREGRIGVHHGKLPAWADGKPHVFFQAAETYERANGIAFEEWKIALPQELSHRENMALTRDLIRAIAGDAADHLCLPCPPDPG